jgi:hypothetical protein
MRPFEAFVCESARSAWEKPRVIVGPMIVFANNAKEAESAITVKIPNDIFATKRYRIYVREFENAGKQHTDSDPSKIDE